MIQTLLVDLVVAQDGGYSATPSVATGRTSGGEGATGTADATGGAAGGASSPFSGDFFLILVLVVVAMFGFSIMSQRKQKKQRQAMMDTLAKRDVVQTIGGIIGTVVDIKGDRVVLCVHEGSNARITVTRSAIQTTLEVAGGEAAADDSGEDTED